MFRLILAFVILFAGEAVAKPCKQSSAEGRWLAQVEFAKDNVNCTMTCERMVIDNDGFIAPDAICKIAMSQSDGYAPVETAFSTSGRLRMDFTKKPNGDKNDDQLYCDRSTEGWGEEFCLDNGLCFHISVMQSHDWQKAKRNANGKIKREGRGINPGDRMDGMVRVNNGAVGSIYMIRRSMGPDQINP
jgi:hypothetical protein